MVGPGERDRPWQIDTISGATVSSKAVASIAAGAAAEWVPRLAARRGDFSAGEDAP
ncbi:MAG: FMN-binding protein [Myxococcales bacterium]|nr:FMN-binding protein [Myxococcales bacterium]